MSWRIPIVQKHSNDHHILHYLMLIVGLFLYAILLAYFKSDSAAQIAVAGAGSIFYMLWGIVHHHLEGRLTTLVALEYILVSTFVFLLMLVVLYL